METNPCAPPRDPDSAPGPSLGPYARVVGRLVQIVGAVLAMLAFTCLLLAGFSWDPLDAYAILEGTWKIGALGVGALVVGTLVVRSSLSRSQGSHEPPGLTDPPGGR